MAFNEQDWSQRFQTMGDTAEAVFAEVAPFGKFERLGWRRPSVSMKRMDPALRHMPDFYTSTGHLVEVMGCGKDGILKLKVVKLDSLEHWKEIQPVVLFVWNSHAREWMVIEWDELMAVLDRTSWEKSAFDDGNEYYPLPWAHLTEMASFVGEV